MGSTQDKVVKIGIVFEDGAGVCSGAIISADAKVLTCAHCFRDEGIKKVFIKFHDGTYYPAELLKLDSAKDLALIAPISSSTIVTPFFKMSKLVKVGQQVVSFGSPMGFPLVVTVGYISMLLNDRWVMHTAFINPGNSGGPLVNLQGKLIGINELYIEGQGMFIAIPTNVIEEFLQHGN